MFVCHFTVFFETSYGTCTTVAIAIYYLPWSKLSGHLFGAC